MANRLAVILSAAKDLARAGDTRARRAADMPRSRKYYVYILTNRSGTLYIGVTSNVVRRLAQHAEAAPTEFTGRYACTRLVYLEAAPDPVAAIAREKQLKGWVRRKKVAMINSVNPEWRDLAAEWRLRGEAGA